MRRPSLSFFRSVVFNVRVVRLYVSLEGNSLDTVERSQLRERTALLGGAVVYAGVSAPVTQRIDVVDGDKSDVVETQPKVKKAVRRCASLDVCLTDSSPLSLARAPLTTLLCAKRNAMPLAICCASTASTPNAPQLVPPITPTSLSNSKSVCSRSSSQTESVLNSSCSL